MASDAQPAMLVAVGLMAALVTAVAFALVIITHALVQLAAIGCAWWLDSRLPTSTRIAYTSPTATQARSWG